MGNKIAIGGGKFFDEEKAVLLKSEYDFDGRNQICKATGKEFYHARVCVTASGVVLKNCWSNWQGSRETYEEIGIAEAVSWLADAGWTTEELEERAGEKGVTKAQAEVLKELASLLAGREI
jgi:hypothetical protein